MQAHAQLTQLELGQSEQVGLAQTARRGRGFSKIRIGIACRLILCLGGLLGVRVGEASHPGPAGAPGLLSDRQRGWTTNPRTMPEKFPPPGGSAF